MLFLSVISFFFFFMFCVCFVCCFFCGGLGGWFVDDGGFEWCVRWDCKAGFVVDGAGFLWGGGVRGGALGGM